MATITQYSQYSLLSMAAYAQGLGTAPLSVALQTADFTQAQADQFITDGWEVINQSSDALYGDSGFSATLFHNVNTGEYVFANRGTAGVQDLFTDAWGIATLGIAGAQIIDMYRYYKQLITPAGMAVTYTADEIEKLHGIGVFYDPTEFLTTGMVQSYVQNDVGIGGLSAGQDIMVTGHSLGGHLSVWLNALIPGSIDHVYTFNGAGLGGLFHSAATLVAGLFGGISSIEDDASITNIYGEGGATIIAGVGGNVGQNVPVGIEAKSTLDSIADGLYNHSVVTLSDALSVSAMLSELDPAISLSTNNALLKSASNGNATMLESVLDVLRRAFLGVPISNVTATDNRDVLHNNIKTLTDNAAFQSLAGNLHISPASSVLATEARTEFSALIALQTLSTVVLRGSTTANQSLLDATLGGVHADSYAQWQADQGLSAEDRAAGKANFSDQWLSDRATMLGMIIQQNSSDSTDSLSVSLSGNVATTYLDVITDRQIVTGDGSARRISFGGEVGDSLNGATGNDRLYGGAGGDNLWGGGGNDYLEGGDDGDALYGEAGDDTLIGGAGNDALTSGGGRDVLIGGAGFDAYTISQGALYTTIRDADGAGAIVIERTDGSTYTLGSNIKEQTAGSGYYEDDQHNRYQLSGDTLVMSIKDTGQTVVIEGFQSMGGAALGLTLQESEVPVVAPGSTTVLGDRQIDDLDPARPGLQWNVDELGNAVGIPGAHAQGDILFGSDGDDLMVGGALGDQLYGDAGNDVMYADQVISIADVLQVGIADAGVLIYPRVDGGINDALAGGDGDDTLVGSAAADFLSGGTGLDLLIGGQGDDILVGDMDETIPTWRPRSTTLNDEVESLMPFATGSSSTRDIYIDSDKHLLGAMGWTITRTHNAGADDRLYGGGGNDWIIAGGGDDDVFGDGGNDTIYGASGADSILGGTGNDRIYADGYFVVTDDPGNIDSSTDFSTSNDFVDGGEGDDYIEGGAANDVLVGGSGNDEVWGGSRDDLLEGGDGADNLYGDGGSDTLLGGAGSDRLEGDQDDNHSTAGDDWLDGGEGDDVLIGRDGNDTLLGQAGADTAWGDAGSDTLLGGDGNDYLQGDSTSTPESAQGDDYLDGGAGNDTLLGDGGNDTLLGGAGNDQMTGGAGDDYVSGGAGTDYLWGGEGNDILDTGPTGNLLASGDVLQGEAGDDTYLLNEGMGSVRIEDTEGENLLVLAGASSGDVGVQMVDGLIILTLASGDQVMMSAATANTMDNGLYSSSLVQNEDGSSEAVITTYNSDGGSIAYSFDTATDGSVTQINRYYDSSETLTRKLLREPDGATVDKAYAYRGDGSKTVTTLATAVNGTDVTTTVDEFGTDGLLAQKTVTQPTGSSTNYTYYYDAAGVLTDRVATASDGTQTTTYYNATGQVVSREVIAASGVITETFYDTDGALTDKIVAKTDGTITTYHYNAAGEYSAVELINPDGSTSNKAYAYQADGSKTITDVTTAPSVSGSTTIVSDYNAAGQLMHKLETNPDGSTADRAFVYAVDGSKVVTMISVAAGTGAITMTVFSYDAAGTLIDKVITQPDAVVIDYDYAPDGSVNHSLQTNTDGSTVEKTYSYSANGAHTVVVATTVAGTGATSTATYTYDAFDNLRSKEVSNPDGSSVTDLYSTLGKLTTEYTHNVDGSLTTEKYTYQADGSKTSTVSTTMDGELVGQLIAKSFDSNGTLRSKHIANDDGSVSDYTYDSSGRLTQYDQHAADGSELDKTYIYNVDGSKTETVATMAAGETVAKVVVNFYDVAGLLTGKKVANADGSSTLYQYNADGSVAGTDTHNLDGSYVIKSYAYYADGSKTMTVDTIPAAGGAGKVVVYQYDATGAQISKTVSTEVSSVMDDGSGNIATHYFAPNGFETHTTWQHGDGSTGQDNFGRDGSSFGMQNNADGSSSSYSNDGKGNLLTTYFDASGAKTGDVWQHSDGSSGTDTFFADGSSEGNAIYADGTSSYKHNDGQGSDFINYYDVNGVLTSDVYHEPNGYIYTDVYAPDGSYISGTWSNGTPGDFGTWALQQDGTWLEQYTDGAGYSSVIRYDADYSNELSSHIEEADGRVSDYVRYDDGSWVSTWSAPDGGFGFTVYNGETGEARTLDYYSINNWVAMDKIDVAVGASGIESIYSVALSAWDGEVRYYDNTNPGELYRIHDGYLSAITNVATRIATDTDFGLDPLRGITLTPVDNGDGYDMDVRVSADALLVYSSDMAASYVNSDPLASVHALIESDGADYFGHYYSSSSVNDVRGISYNSDNLSLNGYVTYTGTTEYRHQYMYHGVNGADGYWNYDPNDPIYVENSGGSSGGGSFHSGSNAGGSYVGGFGTTTRYIGDGYVQYGNDSLLQVSDSYLLNSSSYVQTTFTGSGPLG